MAPERKWPYYDLSIGPPPFKAGDSIRFKPDGRPLRIIGIKLNEHGYICFEVRNSDGKVFLMNVDLIHEFELIRENEDTEAYNEKYKEEK